MGHNYFVYITTNYTKSVLFVGVTNDLATRLQQHYENGGKQEAFAGKYHCYHLVYRERHSQVEYAIAREKEIKKWRRGKKEGLINTLNPEWSFLNQEILE